MSSQHTTAKARSQLLLHVRIHSPNSSMSQQVRKLSDLYFPPAATDGESLGSDDSPKARRSSAPPLSAQESPPEATVTGHLRVFRATGSLCFRGMPAGRRARDVLVSGYHRAGGIGPKGSTSMLHRWRLYRICLSPISRVGRCRHTDVLSARPAEDARCGF